MIEYLNLTLFEVPESLFPEKNKEKIIKIESALELFSSSLQFIPFLDTLKIRDNFHSKFQLFANFK